MKGCPMNWYIECLRKYADFSGRARRREFWMFHLFYLVFALVVGFVEGWLGFAGRIVGPLSVIYILSMIVPSSAVAVRRLHDTNRSGWWLWISLVPIAGFALLYFWAQDGQRSANQYGPDPKAPVATPPYEPQHRVTAPVG